MAGKVIRRVYGIIMGIVIQLVCMHRWIPAGKDEVSSIGFLIRAIRSGDILKATNQAVIDFPGGRGLSGSDLQEVTLKLLLCIICFLVVQLLCMIYILFSFKGKGLMFCGVSMVIITFIMAVGQVGPTTFIMLDGDGRIEKFFLVLLLIVAAAFVGCRLMEDIGAANRQTKALKKRDREKKKERRRRLWFPGKYNSLFYQVIWSNCRYHWKDYVTFIVAGSMAVSFIIAGFGMWSLLKGQELNTMLLSFLGIAVVISVFLIVNILLFYLRNRMKGYGILLNLGMRKMTLRLYMAVELLICILLTLIFGFVIGNGILGICKFVLVHTLGKAIITGSMSGKVWLMVFGTIAGMFLVSLMLTRDNYYGPEVSGAADKAVMAEPVGTRFGILFLILGSGSVLGSCYYFNDKTMTENMMMPAIFLIGVYFLMKSIWGILLRHKEKVPRLFYKDMLKNNYQYYRFKTMFRYTFFLMVIHVIILFVYAKDISVVMTAESPKELFPYDYVCIADESDRKDFEDLERQGLTRQVVYPMMRVSNLDKTKRMEDYREQPLKGQHIGVSETVYQKMCKDKGIKPKELNLKADGSNVYIIFQQDRGQKAHPLDYYMLQEKPCLRIGQPVETAERGAKKQYPEREIAGEEKTIITGALLQGSQENILVFSDEYMKNQSVSYEGPGYLVLMNLTSQKAEPEVEKMLEGFKERHVQDEQFDNEIQSCYEKDELMSQVTKGRVMHTTVNMFIMAVLLVAGTILFYMKVESEMEEKKRQHTFLSLIGMSPRERRGMIRYEFVNFLVIPLVLAAVIIGIFSYLTFSLRMFTATDMMQYMKVWGMVSIEYVLLQSFVITCFEYYTIRKAGSS